MHAGDAKAQLESQRGVVAQRLRDGHQVLAPHLEGELVAEHHDALDGGVEDVVAERGGQRVDDLVEVAAVGSRRAAGQRDVADQPAVTGGVAAALDAEHAAALADHLGPAVAVAVGAGHDRSSPLSSMVGRDASAASSAAAMASARLTPSGIS